MNRDRERLQAWERRRVAEHQARYALQQAPAGVDGGVF